LKRERERIEKQPPAWRSCPLKQDLLCEATSVLQGETPCPVCTILDSIVRKFNCVSPEMPVPVSPEMKQFPDLIPDNRREAAHAR